MKIKNSLCLILLLITFSRIVYCQNYSLKIITGKDLIRLKQFVIKLRIEIYKNYPYLYEANLDEENEYFDWFSKLKHSAIAVAYFKNMPVGFVTGTSLVDFDEHLKGSILKFKQANLNPENYYYFTDLLILPEHRNNSLSKKLGELIENHAKMLGYKSGCFATESHEIHPLKPKNYESLDKFHSSLGYKKVNIDINFQWQTIQPDGIIKDQDHTLNFWLKDLRK